MHYFCQQSLAKHLNYFKRKLFNYSAFRSKMSDAKDGRSKTEYRDKGKPEVSSSSESDDDEHGASSDYTNPTSDKSKLECLQQYLKSNLHISSKKESDSSPKNLKIVDFDGLVDHWKEKGFKKIVTMVGAGISTSAGIPDFRSPETGLYHNLQKYKLPYPTAIFEIGYFRKNPQPFFALAKELYPGQFKPTPCHYFVRLLHEKGLLLRHYSQNIDTLEHIAGIPSEKMVEAHGTFHTNHCIDCRLEYSMEWVKEQIFADHVPTCTKCNGVVKPDIVFFGEDLPRKFYVLPDRDFNECDLLIIMGTSLEVQPFASLMGRPNKQCVRLLINRELVGKYSRFDFLLGTEGLKVGKSDNKRDVALLGDCDDGIIELANKVGLGDELKELIEREHKKIDEANKESNKTKAANPKEGGSKESKSDTKSSTAVDDSKAKAKGHE
ncbi:NAD-dependent protein deacetylase Sirt2 [Contarinia nasturtii]|uniref:NAD-dependent protein deacetylase Sirt2 n=1 Tax=Contarinia nasturtii TaxID=265458 RepID=UPI0012D3E354|nr:NAD-dependent protein deacetylase Sirt2 [Contarinia nasturtii]